jgi:hypothetical protein
MKAPIGECWALNPIWQDSRFDIVSLRPTWTDRPSHER